MADDVNPALRAELEAAKAVLEPQLKGLLDLIRTNISGDLQEEIRRQIEIRQRRSGLIQSVINSLDAGTEARLALERDGYPAIEGSELSAALFAELVSEESALEAAASHYH
jgi:hypothetical protein